MEDRSIDNAPPNLKSRRPVWLAALLALCLAVPALAQDELGRPPPEPGSGWRPRPPATAREEMAAAAHPLAAEAGAAMLAAGGSAIDAAIAIQLVLGLVEPQSSGIGGGAFALVWDAGSRHLTGFDGRETAPAAATPGLFLDAAGRPLAFHDAVVGGRSVGVPGVPRLMAVLHAQGGRLPWASLFEPAIRLAEDGFEITPRFVALVAGDRFLPRDPAARAYFFQPDGTPWPVGTRLRNPAYADTLRRLAEEGADAFYAGPIAADLVAAVTAEPNPGLIALPDLAAYRVVEREPVCLSFRSLGVCSMPPPSSGGVTLLQILGMIEQASPKPVDPLTVAGAHLLAEASRLAFADRDQYLADPAFVAQPVAGLLNTRYLAGRSDLIRPERSLGRATPGQPPLKAGQVLPRCCASDASPEYPSTTHLVVVDRDGNAVSMTTTVEDAFGSRRMVRGFLLNNQLTDFSFLPERDGRPVANRVEPGKRPRSSMAPVIAFSPSGDPVIVAGSPGGSFIIGYVAQALLGMIDGGLDPQAAVSAGHVLNRNGPTELEAGTPAAELKAGLEQLGHEVVVREMASGLHAIVRRGGELVGGVDPRREGEAAGR